MFAMTHSHWEATAWRFPAVESRLQLISPAEEDIADPIGGALPVYERCAKQIIECLEKRLAEIGEAAVVELLVISAGAGNAVEELAGDVEPAIHVRRGEGFGATARQAFVISS